MKNLLFFINRFLACKIQDPKFKLIYLLLVFSLPLGCLSLLNGCVAAVPVVAMAGGAAGGAAAVSASKQGNGNQLREQYPNIDFGKPAPVGTIYANSFNQVWIATIDTLYQMKELMSMADKNSGLIRTSKRNFDDVSLKGKGSENSTHVYEYIISIKTAEKEVSVETLVPFWEERLFVSPKEINNPEASGVMRHIFYYNLNKRLNLVAFRLADGRLNDLRSTSHKNGGSGQEPAKGIAEAKPAEPIQPKEADKSGVQPSKIAILEKAKIKRSSVKLLDVPFKSGKTLLILSAGDEVEKVEEKKDWLKVRSVTNGSTIEGWIIKYDCEGYTRTPKRKTQAPSVDPFPIK
jgi:hypothetical protein